MVGALGLAACAESESGGEGGVPATEPSSDFWGGGVEAVGEEMLVAAVLTSDPAVRGRDSPSEVVGRAMSDAVRCWCSCSASASNVAQLLLQNLGLNLEVAELVAHALILDSQALALLLSDFNLFFEHDAALDGDVVFGLEVFEGRGRVSRLALKVVVGDFNVAQPKVERPVDVAQRRDFLLQRILR